MADFLFIVVFGAIVGSLILPMPVGGHNDKKQENKIVGKIWFN